MKISNTHYPFAGILIAIILAILSFLFINNFFYRESTESIAKNLEKYPKATVWELDGLKGGIKNNAFSWIYYQTDDSEEMLISYYKDILPKESWDIKEKDYNNKIYFTKGTRKIYFENFCSSQPEPCRRILII